ncbi:MAG: 2-oxoacid:acceptor oxidoreductase subunit alpha [Thermodesulfobacteriota bacterium]
MEDINIVIGGAAGEGVQTVGAVLAETLISQGYAVFAWQEFESRIRGGQNSYSLRIGESVRNAPLMQADILLTLNDGASEKYHGRLKEDGVLIGPSGKMDPAIVISFADLAKERLESGLYANTIAVGAIIGTLDIPLETLFRVLLPRFEKKGEKVVSKNREAAEIGFRMAEEKCRDICPWRLPEREERYHLIDGHEAAALGAVQAGCRFMAGYPMSPATNLLTFLAKEDERFGVFVEQAEDEIAAVNMAIGASFAGVRAMTASSGGGFALMVEAISLAGMIETPLVIVLAQRPGPATGLPTRTAQGDLLFAIHSGHGEFPKAVLAPADPKDAFHQMVFAFNLADQYQIPVIVLTDQFLADSAFSIADFEVNGSAPEYYLADPADIQEYRRYRITENGVSPRLYPGQSRHLVGADSDEHDEFGHITEDLEGIALDMNRKRLRKVHGLQKEIPPPTEYRLTSARTVFVAWGSSRDVVLECMDLLKSDGFDVGLIHFSGVWPLPEYAFPTGKDYVSVEGNATGQMARLLENEYGIRIDRHIARTDGLPFTADYIRSRFHE